MDADAVAVAAAAAAASTAAVAPVMNHSPISGSKLDISKLDDENVDDEMDGGRFRIVEIVSKPKLERMIFKCKDLINRDQERIMKRMLSKDEQIIMEIKRLVEVNDILPNSIAKYYAWFTVTNPAANNNNSSSSNQPLALDRFYFVTDMYESTDVERLLTKMRNKNQVISSSKIMDFGMHILDALAFIHARGIIHRDLRPKNLQIDELGHIILTDFGLKSIIDVFSDEAKISLNYMSPELFENDGKNYGHKIDIWSFGCILYELITLERVIDGSSLIQIAPKLSSFKSITTSQLPNDIDPELESILKKTLLKNPNEREEAVTLRDQLSLAYESKSKERFSSIIRDMSLSSSISGSNNNNSININNNSNNNESPSIGSLSVSDTFIGAKTTSSASSSNINLRDDPVGVATTATRAHFNQNHHGHYKSQSSINGQHTGGGGMVPNYKKSKSRLHRMGDIYFDEKNFHLALDSYLDELTRSTSNNGDQQQQQQSPSTAELLSQIGLTYENLDQYANALKYYIQCLDVLQSEHNHDTRPHADVAKCLQNIAIVNRYMGEFQTALRYDLKSLEMRTQLYASVMPDHIEIADSLNSCGDAYLSLGDTSTALSYYKRSLDMRKRLAPDQPNSLELAKLLNCMGVAYARLEKFEQALEYKLQALEMRLKCHNKSGASGSGDHHDVAASLNSVGVAYNCLNDYARAIDYYTRSLDMRYRLFVEKWNTASKQCSVLTATTMVVQRPSLKEMSENKSASSAAAALDEIADKDIANLLFNLGVAHENLRNYQLALDYHQKCLQMRRNVYSNGFKVEDHADIADSLQTIGTIYGKLNQHKQCLEFMLKSCEIKKLIYKSHPVLIACLNSIGRSYEKLGKHEQALDYFFESLEMCKLMYSSDHMQIAEVLTFIGDSYASQEAYTKANFYYYKSMDMRQKLLQDNNRDMAKLYTKIANAYFNSNDYQGALNFYRDALKRRQNNLLDQHSPNSNNPNNGNNNSNNNNSNNNNSNNNDNSTEHAEMTELYSRLGDTYMKMDDFKQASEFYSKALEAHQKGWTTMSTTSSESDLIMMGGGGGSSVSMSNLSSSGGSVSGGGIGAATSVVVSHEMIELHSKLGHALFAAKEYESAIKSYRDAVNARRALSMPDDHGTVKLLYNIGVVYLNLGEAKKAHEYFFKALDLVELVLGSGDYVEKAECLQRIGDSYSKMFNYKKALESYARSADIRVRMNSEATPLDEGLVECYIKAGKTCLTSTLDDVDGALNYFGRAVGLFKAAYGGFADDLELARALNCLGVAYQRAGELKSAFEMKSKSYEIRQRMLAAKFADHADLAESLDSLGDAYEEQGDLKRALELKTSALGMRTRLYEDVAYHDEIADSLVSIARTNELMGHYRMASDNYMKALLIKKQLCSDDDPAVFDLHNMLAQVGVRDQQKDHHHHNHHHHHNNHHHPKELLTRERAKEVNGEKSPLKDALKDHVKIKKGITDKVFKGIFSKKNF